MPDLIQLHLFPCVRKPQRKERISSLVFKRAAGIRVQKSGRWLLEMVSTLNSEVWRVECGVLGEWACW